MRLAVEACPLGVVIQAPRDNVLRVLDIVEIEQFAGIRVERQTPSTSQILIAGAAPPRRAPPGASGPPRSRSGARRTSGSNGYRHGSSDAHAHDACPKRHPGMHAACPRRIAEDGRPTRAVTSGEEPAAAPSDGRGIGRSGRRRSLAAAGIRDRRYFRSTFPQIPTSTARSVGPPRSRSQWVAQRRPQRARSA